MINYLYYSKAAIDLCDNYNGISFMDTMAKIYDTIIMNRLLL